MVIAESSPAADVVERDLVSQDVMQALAALPIERRVLLVAETLAAGEGLTQGLRALAGMYSRAARAQRPSSAARHELVANVEECRRMGLQVELVEELARVGGEQTTAALALHLAEVYTLTRADDRYGAAAREEAGHAERRALALAAHLAETAGAIERAS